MTKKILGISGNEVGSTHKVPKPTAVHPFGSKILVEVLNPDEVLGTNLYVAKTTEVDGAPQAYIVELGPGIGVDSGLKVGQRVYWSGKGTSITDPRTTSGRVRAMLEVHNILAVIEEDAQ